MQRAALNALAYVLHCGYSLSASKNGHLRNFLLNTMLRFTASGWLQVGEMVSDPLWQHLP